MIEHVYDELAPVVAQVAKAAAKKYAAYGADADDLQQECWVWAMSHIENIEHWRSEGDQWLKQVAKSMQRECSAAGQKAKGQHKGYSHDDLILDTMGVLRETLPAIYHPHVVRLLQEQRDDDEVDPPEVPRERDPHSPLDARWAYEGLDDPEDRDLIDAFYRDGCRNKEMAESRGVSEQSMSGMHRRVLRRMAKSLGKPAEPPLPTGEFDGWEGRRAQSNSRAQALQGSYTDG